MVPLEWLAYPILSAAIYGTYRVGKRPGARWDEKFEWLRVTTLAVLLGVLVAVQLHLVTTGVVRSDVGIAIGVLGALATLGLIAIHLFERSSRRSAKPSPWLVR